MRNSPRTPSPFKRGLLAGGVALLSLGAGACSSSNPPKANSQAVEVIDTVGDYLEGHDIQTVNSTLDHEAPREDLKGGDSGNEDRCTSEFGDKHESIVEGWNSEGRVIISNDLKTGTSSVHALLIDGDSGEAVDLHAESEPGRDCVLPTNPEELMDTARDIISHPNTKVSFGDTFIDAPKEGREAVTAAKDIFRSKS